MFLTYSDYFTATIQTLVKSSISITTKYNPKSIFHSIYMDKRYMDNKILCYFAVHQIEAKVPNVSTI